jgi:hypothetical protein
VTEYEHEAWEGRDVSGGDKSGMPPSAAGSLEPYGVRVLIHPVSRPVDPQQFLVRLLEDLAAACLASGASLIGHLKCLLHAPGGVLACNLTSVRSGSRCTARGDEARKMLVPGDVARLDLAVLVYGLPQRTIETLLRTELAGRLEPNEVSWS